MSSEVDGGAPEVDGEVDGKSSEVGEVGNPVMDFVDGRNAFDGGTGERRETTASITSPGGSTTSVPSAPGAAGRTAGESQPVINPQDLSWLDPEEVCSS